jgi:hypothetical protein
MILRVQETTAGYVIVIPPDAAKAWQLRENFPLEVHRVGSSSEQDEPATLAADHEKAIEVGRRILQEYESTFRELAKGPEGRGPHDDQVK